MTMRSLRCPLRRRIQTRPLPACCASIEMRAPLGSLLRSLSAACRRLVVIHGPAMPFASHEAASLPNATSSNVSDELSHFGDSSSAPESEIKQEVLDLVLSKFDGTIANELREFLSLRDFNINETGTLLNSCGARDGEFFNLLAEVPRHRGKRLFAVGPVNLVTVDRNEGSDHECLKWLDKQSPDSAVYVSFGSTLKFSDEQIKQLAIGLTGSGHRFLWLLRETDRGDIFAAEGDEKSTRQFYLPPGSVTEIEGMGIVVSGWALQLGILAHPSTGAFVSHCGWDSCMESLSKGVPIIAWPMHSDQPRNAKMVMEYLKAGIVVRDWARHEVVISGSEIVEVIKRMMVFNEEKEIRMRRCRCSTCNI